ncbi:MAG: Rieske 2Fe-2S domain-containing protein [Actinobacteria bacterium]|nr:Rieske 2Fe-2S domain-containing protein [Actinomycetota bacterium]
MDRPEPGFERAAPSDEVGGPPFLRVTIGDTEVLLGRLPDGAAVAFDPACPHQGHQLSRGFVTDDGCIECPHHFYAYDARTGTNTFPGDDQDLALPVHEVQEAEGWVWVRLAAPTS